MNSLINQSNRIIFIYLATSGCDKSKPNIQRKREQLHLALEWNRVDIAKNYIMKNERDWAVRNMKIIFFVFDFTHIFIFINIRILI